ncbi:MAG: hypothetical protein ACLQVN_16400 [Bryobacteraceae bacterium]
MRYWSFFAAKVAVASVTLYGLLLALDLYLPHDSLIVSAPKVHATRPATVVPHAAPGAEANSQRDVIWLVPGAVATPAEEARLLAPLSHGGDRLLCNLALMGWFLLAAGVGYLIVWDQRYRCRTCLRRLRMPVETGSWGQMLQFGRPRIEYICVYGHGTLRAEELQISGREQPEWTPNSDDYWRELCGSRKDSSDRP